MASVTDTIGALNAANEGIEQVEGSVLAALDEATGVLERVAELGIQESVEQLSAGKLMLEELQEQIATVASSITDTRAYFESLTQG